MSRYIRDDKTFRAQIANLAAAGLKFPTAPAKLPEYPLHFDEITYRIRDMSEATDYEIKPKGRLPEVVAGVVMGIVVLGIIALAILAGLGLVTLLGGAH